MEDKNIKMVKIYNDGTTDTERNIKKFLDKIPSRKDIVITRDNGTQITIVYVEDKMIITDDKVEIDVYWVNSKHEFYNIIVSGESVYYYDGPWHNYITQKLLPEIEKGIKFLNSLNKEERMSREKLEKCISVFNK